MISNKVIFGATVAAGCLSAGVSALAVEQPPLISTAMEVASRATSSSEVISLNLTNLLVLLALKVAIVVLGYMTGALGSVGFSSEANASARAETVGESLLKMDKSEMTGSMCFLLYTSGDEAKLDCMARFACESNEVAEKLLDAGKMWYKMHKIINTVPFHDKYVNIMDKVKEGIEQGKAGKSCKSFKW